MSLKVVPNGALWLFIEAAAVLNYSNVQAGASQLLFY